MSLERLPVELILPITKYLDLKDISSWSLTSKRFRHVLIQPLLAAAAACDEARCIDQPVYRKFHHLYLAIEGNQPYAVRFLLDHHLAKNIDDDSKTPFLTSLLVGMPFSFDKRLGVAQIVMETCGFSISNSANSGRTPLHRAAARGEIAFMEQLVAAGAPVDISGPDGKTPLVDAVTCGQLKAIEFLLEAGATPDIGCEVLAGAAKNDHFETVKYLIGRGILDCGNREQMMTEILISACSAWKDPTDMARFLLEWGATPSFETLCLSCQNDHTETVRLFIDAGADASSRDENGRTIFHHVKDVEAARLLYGVTPPDLVKAVCNEGTTALWRPFSSSPEAGLPKQQLALFLVEHGCDPSVADRLHGINGLHYAAMNADAVLVEAILKTHAGPWINDRTAEGSTALHLAASTTEGDPLRCIELLLEHGADIQAVNKAGDTALHRAFQVIRQDRFLLTRRLIDGGVDISAYSTYAGTALHMALKAMDSASALMLIDAGCDLSATLNYNGLYTGMTALHLAVSHGMLAVVERLLRPDALSRYDPNLPSRNGDTPLHLTVGNCLFHGSSAEFMAMAQQLTLGMEPPTAGPSKSSDKTNWVAMVSLLWRCPRVNRYAWNRFKYTPVDMLMRDIRYREFISQWR